MIDACAGPPLVSVVVAVWNGEATIARALDSALAQTVPVELIVIDDASTDQTMKILESYAELDPRVIILRQPSNLGPAAARNRALAQSSAPWIAVLDSDDFMEPERLAKLVSKAEAASLDFLADDIEKVDENDPSGGRQRLFSDHEIGQVIIDASTFILGNLSSRHGGRREMGFLKPIMRRAFLEEHGLTYADLRLGEDFELYARALIKGARFGLTDPAGYVAMVRSNSLSGRHSTSAHAALMGADRRLLGIRGVDDDIRAALRAHLLEQHKKWAWRSLIDAVRQRDLLSAMACFMAPPSVVASLFGHLGFEIRNRAWRRKGHI